MQELGVSTNANYKITFMLDSAAMITVHTPRRGLIDVSTSFSLNLFLHSSGILSHPFKIFNKMFGSFHAGKLQESWNNRFFFYWKCLLMFWVVYLDVTAFKSNCRWLLQENLVPTERFSLLWGVFVLYCFTFSFVKANLLMVKQKSTSVHSCQDSGSYRRHFHLLHVIWFTSHTLYCVVFSGEASWCYLGKVFRILQQKKYYYVWWYRPKLPDEPTEWTQGNVNWNFHLLLLFLDTSRVHFPISLL